MATLDGESILTERRSELFDKMELAKAEILEKFRGFHMELHDKEVKLIRVIDKIWDDTLVKLKRIGTEFEEIEKAKDFTISTVTSNSNREFMESQVDVCNYKLDEIIGKSGVDKAIELKWKDIGLQIGNICRIKANICVDLETQKVIDFESNDAYFVPNRDGASFHTTHSHDSNYGRSSSSCD